MTAYFFYNHLIFVCVTVLYERSDTFPLIVEVIGGVTAQAHEVGLVLRQFGGQGLFSLHIVDVFPDFLRAYFFVEVAIRQEKHRPPTTPYRPTKKRTVAS